MNDYLKKDLEKEVGQLKIANKTLSPEIIDKAVEIEKTTGVSYEDIAICLRDFPELSEKAIKISVERKLCPWDVAYTLKNFPDVAEKAIKNAKFESQSSWLAVEYTRLKEKKTHE